MTLPWHLGDGSVGGKRRATRAWIGSARKAAFSQRCIVQVVLTLTDRHEALHRLGRALADPGRCNILVALLDGPRYPGELAAALGLTRSNMSNHLACLRGCGLVSATAEGRQIRYDIADPNLSHAIRDLLEVVVEADCEH
jgi:DNA-binding transcriptional ArsR family regulator